MNIKKQVTVKILAYSMIAIMVLSASIFAAASNVLHISNESQNNENIDINIQNKEFKTDRFIIKYKDEKGRVDVNAAIKDKIKNTERTKNKSFDVIITKKEWKYSELVSQIKKNGRNVEYIQPDYKLTAASNDPEYDKQWGLYNKISKIPDINSMTENENIRKYLLERAELIGLSPIRIDADVPDAWEKSMGKGIVVAVLDSSMDITHQDIRENIWINNEEIAGNNLDDDGNGYIDDINGFNFADDNGTVYSLDRASDAWHGTFISGIIGAVKDNNKGITGVAPSVQIMPLQVFKNGTAYTSDIVSAIEYAASKGAKIANCSFGTTEYNPALKEAIEKSGMLLVCAAGNNHTDIDASPLYPAAFDSSNIITVTSIDDKGVLSGFSNHGKKSVDIAAPGQDIISTTPGSQYGTSSGTSFATAFVSGEAALILSMDNTLNATELKNRIINTSDKLSSLENKITGGGKINCSNGVNNISSSEIYKITAPENDYAPETPTTDGYNLLAADSWSSGANMVTARSSFGTVEIGGKIYAVGGKNGSYLSSMEEYDQAANLWTGKRNMSVAREAVAVASSYGKVYAIGGYNGSYLNTVEEYDPSTDTWTIKASMPTARKDAGIAVENGKIYVMGGYNGSYLNTVEVYDPLTNIWTAKASLPAARSGFGSQTVNGKIYAVGGYNGSYLNIVNEYDPTTNVWNTKKGAPTSRSAFATAAINSKIYIAGGYNGSGYLNIVEEYNPALDTWLTKTSMTLARGYLSASPINGEIYIIGGFNGSYLSKTEAYAPAADVWVTKASMPAPRDGHGAAAVNGKIYVVGGLTDPMSATNNLEEYDTLTDTWTNKAASPTARFGHAVVSYNGKLYVTGGVSQVMNGQSFHFDEFVKLEVYDPATNVWTTKKGMNVVRSGHAAVEVNGKIYAIGPGKTSEVYDPVSDTWTPIADMSVTRYGFGAAVVNGKIYVIGGVIGYYEEHVNSVEEYDPATDTWTTKAPLPRGRRYLGVTALNGKIYAIGGLTESNFNAVNTVEVYDPAKNKWSTVPGMTVARSSLGVTAADGKIYAIGGL